LEFIFDSGALNGNGVSVYRLDGKYYFEVANGKSKWKVRNIYIHLFFINILAEK